jgi:type IV secretion/conjugal transfer VirB4 family ATPase
MKQQATHTVIPPCAFLDDGVFATVHGESGILLRLEPQDSECMVDVEKNAVARRFESAIRMIEPGCRMYQYLIKRRLNTVAGDRARAVYLENKVLYTFENYVVLMQKGLNVGTLRSLAEGFVIQLSSVMSVRIGNKAEFFSFLRRILNYDPAVASLMRWNDKRPQINYYSTNSPFVRRHGHVEIGDYAAKVMVLRDPPLATEPDILAELRAVPCEAIIVSEWAPLDMTDVRNLIRSKTSHFHTAKIASSLGYAALNVILKVLGASDTHDKERIEDMQRDEGAAAMETQLGKMVADIEENGLHIGAYALSTIIFDKSVERLDRAVSHALKATGEREANMSVETHNVLDAWLASIPGNHDRQRRSMLLTNRNYADLAMLFAPDTGNIRNEHLGRECLAVLETRQLTPYYGNLHYQDVGHTLISGMTGSGKTFLCNYLLEAALKKYDPRVLIFDIGGSYRKLTQQMGGSYLEIGLRHDYTINPFSLPETEENLHFLFSFVKVLMESGKYQLTAVEDDILYRLIPGCATLRGLFAKMPPEMQPYLARWVENGQYARVFDNPEETLTCARLQAYDFEGLEQYPEILEPLLFYILHRATAEIYDNATRSEFKIFLFDESWRFFENDTVKAYIYSALKTGRKRNLSIWMATQSMGDLSKSAMLATVAENCGSVILLPNPRMNEDEYRQVFKLNERELQEVLRMQPKCESLWKVGTAAGKVLILDAGTEVGFPQKGIRAVA